MTTTSFTSENEYVYRAGSVLAEINLLIWVVIAENFFFNHGHDRQFPQEDVRSKS